MDPLYQGATGRSYFPKWVTGGVLKFLRRSDQTEFVSYDGTNKRTIIQGVTQRKRTRVSIAQVNAGFTLLAALPGYIYRLADIRIIAIGGNAAAVTSVDVKGTRAAGSVSLAVFAQASLTRSTALYPGIAGTTILADGASFTNLDVNTAITVIKNGADVTTATDFDIELDYEIIPA